MNSKAFTLLEAIVVVAIITLIASLGAWRFMEFLRIQKVKSFVQEMASDLRYCKSAALKTGNCTFEVNATGGFYRLEFGNETKEVNFPDYVDVSDNITTVTFERFGLPNRQGSIVVRDRENSVSYKIVINFAGRINIERE